MSTNDITGDRLVSKVPTKEYEDNFDRIFRQAGYEKDIDKLHKYVEDCIKENKDELVHNPD